MESVSTIQEKEEMELQYNCERMAYYKFTNTIIGLKVDVGVQPEFVKSMTQLPNQYWR